MLKGGCMRTALQLVERGNLYRLPAIFALPNSIMRRKDINRELAQLRQAGATYDELNTIRGLYDSFNSKDLSRLTRALLLIINEERELGRFLPKDFVHLAARAFKLAAPACEAYKYENGEFNLTWDSYTEPIKDQIRKFNETVLSPTS